MLPDDVCSQYANSGIKLSVCEIDGTVLVEGKREALLFLAALVTAQADAHDDGFAIGPKGAGRAFFSKTSTKGLYIHRID